MALPDSQTPNTSLRVDTSLRGQRAVSGEGDPGAPPVPESWAATWMKN